MKRFEIGEMNLDGMSVQNIVDGHGATCTARSPWEKCEDYNLHDERPKETKNAYDHNSELCIWYACVNEYSDEFGQSSLTAQSRNVGLGICSSVHVARA